MNLHTELWTPRKKLGVMMKKNYLQEVYSRIYRMAKMTVGKFAIFYIAANILGTGLYFFIQYSRLGNTAIENLLDSLILLSAVNLFLLFIPPFIRFLGNSRRNLQRATGNNRKLQTSPVKRPCCKWAKQCSTKRTWRQCFTSST